MNGKTSHFAKNEKNQDAIYGQQTKWVTLKSGKKVRLDRRSQLHNADHTLSDRDTHKEYQKHLDKIDKLAMPYNKRKELRGF
mgnify:CR=1 FL=1|jgi:hypothetical protein